MAYTKSKTWANLETITHTDLNSIGTDMETYVAGGIPVADLAAPKSLGCTSFHVDSVAGGVTRNLYFNIPASRTFTLHSVQLAFDRDAAGNPTVTLDVQEGGVTVLNSVLSTTTPDAVTEETSFADSSLAGGSTMKLVLTETIGGGNDAGNVCVTLFYKVQHEV